MNTHDQTTDPVLAGANDLRATPRDGDAPTARTLDRALFSAMALGVLYGSMIASALIFLVQGIAK